MPMIIFIPTAAVLLAMSIVMFSALVGSGREQLSGLTGNTQRSPGEASMLPSFSSCSFFTSPLKKAKTLTAYIWPGGVLASSKVLTRACVLNSESGQAGCGEFDV